MTGLGDTLATAALQPDQYEGRMIDLTNQDRQANGLSALQWDPTTLAIARQRAQAQLGQQPLNHYDPLGQLIFQLLLNSNNVPYAMAGENLARSYPVDPKAIEQALMASPEHRANILDPAYTRAAFGFTYDGQPTTGGDLAEIFR